MQRYATRLVPPCHVPVLRQLIVDSNAAGSKWCSRHEELQAKSLKTYKVWRVLIVSCGESGLTSLQRFSFELEAFEECRVSIEYIQHCECSEELHALSDCIRKKWVLTQRTVEARIKHHKLFYAGGDVSHQAFIDNLTKQKMLLEEKLLQIDERAYVVSTIQ